MSSAYIKPGRLKYENGSSFPVATLTSYQIICLQLTHGWVGFPTGPCNATYCRNTRRQSPGLNKTSTRWSRGSHPILTRAFYWSAPDRVDAWSDVSNAARSWRARLWLVEAARPLHAPTRTHEIVLNVDSADRVDSRSVAGTSPYLRRFTLLEVTTLSCQLIHISSLYNVKSTVGGV